MHIKAGLYGSIRTVRQSKNLCLVRLAGILIHETANAFKIITAQNKVKVVTSLFFLLLSAHPIHPALPKQNLIFAFAVLLYSTLSPDFSPPGPEQRAYTPDPFFESIPLRLLRVLFQTHRASSSSYMEVSSASARRILWGGSSSIRSRFSCSRCGRLRDDGDCFYRHFLTAGVAGITHTDHWYI
ncbi:hypothetical protein BDQ12DRAFT_728619 [Crucibulum laeve]|uniref:Uncharacterized protein n=1 Tax=Crucibulum laeve TaxID=68775 RepID=A0A5C3LUS0_9AGAR|nr:hypothetical protein BDQ12DRAFT_728619 [Crucibulum laeve]